MSALSAWDSFYVIVGSSAGALIGLQFVVMTLIADKPQAGMSEAGRAFATLLSALIEAPWPDVDDAAWVAGAVGLSGLAYMALPVQRMRRQNAYQMDMEDWTFHVILPFAAYSLLVLSRLLGFANMPLALFGLAAAALVLLFTGIHNAWDAVAYQVYVVRRNNTEKP
jgi:hypothetical protein